MLPLGLFRSRQFTGTNLVTLLVYAALGGFFFLFVLTLQNSLGYSALASGAALMPVNLLMLLVSPRVGRLSARVGHGSRWPRELPWRPWACCCCPASARARGT